VLNAEERFLPQLKKLHVRFPKLRIVLEHATTRAAVEVVKTLGDTVACTITAHHLALTVDDWAGQSFHFCKPVAKFPDDRSALQEVIREGLEFALHSADTFVFNWSSVPRSSAFLSRVRLGPSSSDIKVHSNPRPKLRRRGVHVARPVTPCSAFA